MSILTALLGNRPSKRRRNDVQFKELNTELSGPPMVKWVCPKCFPDVWTFKSDTPHVLKAMIDGHNNAFHGSSR